MIWKLATQLTDLGDQEVKIGMPVEMVTFSMPVEMVTFSIPTKMDEHGIIVY